MTIPHSLMGKGFFPILAGPFSMYLTLCGTLFLVHRETGCRTFAARISCFLVTPTHLQRLPESNNVQLRDAYRYASLHFLASKPSPSLQLPRGLPTKIFQQGTRNFRVSCRDHQSKAVSVQVLVNLFRDWRSLAAHLHTPEGGNNQCRSSLLYLSSPKTPRLCIREPRNQVRRRTDQGQV